MLDIEQIRDAFPFLKSNYRNDKPLIYFDSAASAQKPQSVLDYIQKFYVNDYANIHRGVYERAANATQAYESARDKVAQFIGAESNEIIFTKGTTEGVNLIAKSFVEGRLNPGDNILLTELEHHSNLVPWQMLAKKQGAQCRFIKVDNQGRLELDDLDELLDDKTRILAFSHLSNTLGTINDVQSIIQKAKEKQIPVLLDVAQSITQIPINVKQLDVDFLVFSGHKIYGPTGIGTLFIKAEQQQNIEPYQFGGDMIQRVSFEESRFKEGPSKFEAGTPNILGAVGMAVAIDFVQEIGMSKIQAHQLALTQEAIAIMEDIDGVKIIGPKTNQSGIISFLYNEVHPHDIASLFDAEGIAIRAGHHCTEPLMQKFGLPGTARISFGIYNSSEELDSLKGAFGKIKSIFN
jgi:cysteine desulfurase/selenocysteine lyase